MTWAAGVWRVADPKITLASVSSMFLGSAAAWHDGSISWGWLGLTFLGIFFLEAAKNSSGELFDFDSGTDLSVLPEDRSPFSGGKRVLVDRLMTRKETAWMAVLFYAAGCAIGLWIAAVREPGVLWFGIAGVALAYFYHAPPFKLSYRGLGETAVALTYGPLICCGTFLVQVGEFRREVVLVSIPLGLLIAAFLVINEFPDYLADRGAGKRTLVVRLGKKRAAELFAMIVAAAFFLLVALPLTGLPKTIWLGAIGSPFAVAAARRLALFPEDTARVIPAQKWTLLSFVLFAMGSGVGLIL